MANQPQGLNGLNPLSYMGVNPGTPPNLKTYNRAPTVSDSQNFLIGSIWLFPQATTPATALVWMLTALVGGQATWQMITFDGANEFVTDAGTAFPLAGVLNVLGTLGITTSGAGNTVTISTDGTIATEYLTDNGTAVPVGGVLEVVGGVNMNTAAVPNGGNSVVINLNTSISQPSTTADASAGMYSLGGDRFMYAYGPTNTFLGGLSGNLALTAGSAVNNTGIGGAALNGLTTGANNVSLGSLSGSLVTTGSNNLSAGSGSMESLTTGSDNIILGTNAGSAYTTTESSNILIGNAGSVLEDNTIRIGTQGVGAGQQNSTQIAGIYAAPTGATNQVTIVDSNGFLGSSRGDDGQILIGQTGATGSPAWATLTAGAGVTITNAANSITIASDSSVGLSNFSARVGTTIPNVTGDATTYTIVYDTVNWDVNGDYNPTNGIFTAPVNGYYLFSSSFLMGGLTANNGTICFSGYSATGAFAASWSADEGSWFAGSTTTSTIGQFGSVQSLTVKMQAGDTISYFVRCFGAAGTASVSVIASATPGDYRTYISGYLISTY